MGEERKILNSWKEISSYIGRGVRTVQRYEQLLGFPVRRLGDSQQRTSVMAFTDEIDRWLQNSSTRHGKGNESTATSSLRHKASVEEVLITPELWRRGSHEVDAELVDGVRRKLATYLQGTELDLLNALTHAALTLCSAHTAGFSVLCKKANSAEEYFRWDAMAGVLQHAVGGTTPRDWSPCGTTLDRQSAQLFSYPAKCFTYFADTKPAIVEGLVLPVYLEANKPLGTLWIVSHDSERTFDAADVQIMNSLAHFCAAAVNLIRSRSTRRAEQLRPESTSASA